jgi:hypothetical protein
MISWPRALAVVSGIAAGRAVIGGAAYAGLVTGAVPIDLGIGRRVRRLGPLRIQIYAPREIVFAVIAAPYGERVPRSLQQKVRVLGHGTDMVLAAHSHPSAGGCGRRRSKLFGSACRTVSTSGWFAARFHTSANHS